MSNKSLYERLNLHPIGNKMGIDRMHILCDRIGNPEQNLPCIHVAGTNGKGSVCAMLESIFRAHGYKVGLYTSPHLVRVNERVQINRIPISDQNLSKWIDYLDPIIDQIASEDPSNRPSFWEIINAIAFLEFKYQNVDLAIIETGLGGEFDSTNVVTPLVAVITTIGHDHMDLLGHDLRDIARAKAGIIKPGKPLVLGNVNGPAKDVLLEKAHNLGSPVYCSQETTIPILPFHEKLVPSYQRDNMKTAYTAAEILKTDFKLDENTILEGLKKAEWKGRWDVLGIKNGVTLYVDGAHNEEGFKVLEASIDGIARLNEGESVFVVGVLGMDHAKAMKRLLERYAKKVFFVELSNPRSVKYAEFKPLVSGIPVIELKNLTELFDGTLLEKDDKNIIITGSLYLVGEFYRDFSA